MNNRGIFGKDEKEGTSISDVRKRRKGMARVYWSMNCLHIGLLLTFLCQKVSFGEPGVMDAL